MDKRHLTLLHSNDMHGDFLEDTSKGFRTDGLYRLSGYVNQVRQQEEAVIYAIAGDMFRGSIIDAVQNIIEEYLSSHSNLDGRIEGRIIIKN